MSEIAAGHFESLTIRGIASELGVSPMALYRHVRDKDDLLDQVVDQLLGPVWRPRVSRRDWSAWVKDAAERFRKFLITQPAALHVYLDHPVVAPIALERMEAILGVLRAAGFGEDDARRAYGTVHTYTIGFAALEASRARSAQSGAVTGKMAQQLASFTTKRQFSDGLMFLLEGIERQRNE